MMPVTRMKRIVLDPNRTYACRHIRKKQKNKKHKTYFVFRIAVAVSFFYKKSLSIYLVLEKRPQRFGEV